MPNSPRCGTTGPAMLQSMGGGALPAPISASSNGTSPKGSGMPPGATMVAPRPREGVAIPTSRPLVQYGEPSYGMAVAQQQQQAVVAPPTAVMSQMAQPVPAPPIPIHEAMRRYFANGTSRFFGVNGEENNEKVWIERRRRLAIKRFGGVKDDYQFDGNAHEDSLVCVS